MNGIFKWSDYKGLGGQTKSYKRLKKFSSIPSNYPEYEKVCSFRSALSLEQFTIISLPRALSLRENKCFGHCPTKKSGCIYNGMWHKVLWILNNRKFGGLKFFFAESPLIDISRISVFVSKWNRRSRGEIGVTSCKIKFQNVICLFY